MQLEVKKVDFPQLIEFNYNELKQEITAKAALYKNMIYTDDRIKEAKADKAQLNKFIAALENERKVIKKQCLKPYEDFEKKIKELVAVVNEPVMLIDTQVKAYEDKQKEEKLEKIKELLEGTEHPEWLQCNQIFDQRWLNATCSLKKVQEAIDASLEQIAADVKSLEALQEFSFEAIECYKQTLDINRAITEGQRLADIQKRKTEAEAARLRAEEEKAKAQEEAEAAHVEVNVVVNTPDGEVPIEKLSVEVPARVWLKFEAYLSAEEAKALGDFCREEGIELRAI